MIPCDICGVLLKALDPRALSEHKRLVHDNDPAACELCGKELKTKKALTDHLYRCQRKDLKKGNYRNFFKLLTLVTQMLKKNSNRDSAVKFRSPKSRASEYSCKVLIGAALIATFST